ncbi:MAG: Asp-tRNA(Asn)/Glu-tRNA(Gln) amidotransferase subunit GatA [Desulfovibrionaceae bacterium]|nr:Asp-tRNA(Asn)/Glu-tRNA(Gln) amidotransferase subunit GatA [Desulfovibrionaceae bacterium]
MSDLTHLTLAEARSALAAGEVTAEAMTVSCLARMDATEPRVGALLARRDAEALDEARALDRQRAERGVPSDKPLWGVPLTVKDSLTLKGTPTTAGSRILEHFTPPYDAFAVSRLKEAGAIILAKTNMDEFAMGSTTEHSAFHPTRNPWDRGRVPGGSSGGSAASVAACQCFASLGSDTGGSIRQPAALCGCVGLKPTYGRISRYGLLAYGSSLDQIGPLARTVEDAALVLQVIAGHDPRDATSAAWPVPDYTSTLRGTGDLAGVRLGLPREFYENDALNPGVRAACRKAMDNARALGAELVDVSLPHTPYAVAAYYILATAEAGSNLARYDGVRYGRRAQDAKNLDDLYTRSRTEGFGEEVQRRILLGAFVLSAGYYDAYYRKAAQVRRLIRQDYDEALTRCDALLAPVSPVPAWPLGGVSDPLQMYLMDIFTLSLNLAGLPGLTVPVGFADGLPVGMQLMGRPFGEEVLLRIGHRLGSSLGVLGQYAPL